MTTTPNLLLPLVEVNQSQKEVIVNQAMIAIDSAICGTSSVPVLDGDNSFTATQIREAQHLVLYSGSPVPTAAIGVVLPAVRRFLVISNACGQDAIVRCVGAGSPPQTVTIPDGITGVMFCDSAEVYGVSATASSSAQAFIDLSDVPASYSGQGKKVVLVNSGGTALEFVARDISVGTFIAGTPTASEIVMRYITTIPFDLASALAGAQGSAITAATAQTDFDVMKNGSSVGTVRWAVSGTVASFIAASPVSFAAGDSLRLVAPASPDATLADISITFFGTRT